MPRKSAPRVSNQTSTAWDSLVSAELRNSGVERAQMFGVEGLKVHGKFYAYFMNEKLLVKLDADEVERLIKTGEGEAFVTRQGRPMKEWALVRAKSHVKWLALARAARSFVGSNE